MLERMSLPSSQNLRFQLAAIRSQRPMHMVCMIGDVMLGSQWLEGATQAVSGGESGHGGAVYGLLRTLELGARALAAL